MIPVLEVILHQFPFRILGFHCDNGSEFINQNVAGMLEKLLIEFTESRAHRTTDNALVEGKNGATVRKHIGYGFIASDHAGAIQRFYTAQLQSLPQLPSALWLRNAQARHTRAHAPRLCSRRLPHTRPQLPPPPSGPIPGYPTTFRKDILFRSCFLILFRLTSRWNAHASPGSSRTGIKLAVQAHLWIGKCWFSLSSRLLLVSLNVRFIVWSSGGSSRPIVCS